MPSIADREHVAVLAERLARELPGLSEGYQGIPTRSGRPEYTEAVVKFWKTYPPEAREEPTKWHAYREYLTDFMLFEDGYGPRIACESEWGRTPREVEWDFDKLRGVKADIKVLIYECDSAGLEKTFRSYLADCALVGPDEAFLFVRFDRDKATAFWWRPSRYGPFTHDEIRFEVLVDQPAVF